MGIRVKPEEKVKERQLRQLRKQINININHIRGNTQHLLITEEKRTGRRMGELQRGWQYRKIAHDQIKQTKKSCRKGPIYATNHEIPDDNKNEQWGKGKHNMESRKKRNLSSTMSNIETNCETTHKNNKMREGDVVNRTLPIWKEYTQYKDHIPTKAALGNIAETYRARDMGRQQLPRLGRFTHTENSHKSHN